MILRQRGEPFKCAAMTAFVKAIAKGIIYVSIRLRAFITLGRRCVCRRVICSSPAAMRMRGGIEFHRCGGSSVRWQGSSPRGGEPFFYVMFQLLPNGHMVLANRQGHGGSFGEASSCWSLMPAGKLPGAGAAREESHRRKASSSRTVWMPVIFTTSARV